MKDIAVIHKNVAALPRGNCAHMPALVKAVSLGWAMAVVGYRVNPNLKPLQINIGVHQADNRTNVSKCSFLTNGNHNSLRF